MNRILTEKEFYHYILNIYQPSSYESLNEDTRFSKKTNYAHLCPTRCYYIYKSIVKKIETSGGNENHMLDLGVYPGTLTRILKTLLGDKILCSGAGLKVDERFKEFTTSFLNRCVPAELDPFYAQSKTVQPLDFDDQTFDIVTATEILEHLISPLHFISEGVRVLRKGGIFIITTPNVSNIGAVVKLILGRSNYEPFTCSPMNLQDSEWRGHVRFYDKSELKALFLPNGCRLVSHRYYMEYGRKYFQKKISQKCVYWTEKVLQSIPMYQEGHLAVFEKL